MDKPLTNHFPNSNGQTVVLTGANGFIAKHICLKLLQAGYNVIGTVRSASSESNARDAILPLFYDSNELDNRLSFSILDLQDSSGWVNTLHDANMLIHTASPNPINQPSDGHEMCEAAVVGTKNVLLAASDANIRNVVITSSVVAIVYGKENKSHYDETDWTDISNTTITPYTRSKTLAEFAAWEHLNINDPLMKLCVINPGFIIGPALDNSVGASLNLIELLLNSRAPVLPKIGLNVGDVRDIANMHVSALSLPDAMGKRIYGGSKYMTLGEIAECVRLCAPIKVKRPIVAPDFVIRLLAHFDKNLRDALPRLGKVQRVSNACAKEVLGQEFMDAETTIAATIDSLLGASRQN